MSDFFQYQSPGFSVVSAVALGPVQVRVVFTAPPLSFTPANFTIAGTQVTDAALDPTSARSVVLTLSNPLPPGQYTVTVQGLQADSPPIALSDPTSATFDAWQLLAGAENDTAETTLRKNIPGSMRGRVWDALIYALAQNEQYAWDQAQAVFDQMFLATAQGKYLDQRGAEEYVPRPANVGMSDDTYRDLVVAVKNNRLTLPAMLQVLDLFFGAQAVHAHLISTAAEPFLILDGATQSFTFDNRTTAELRFDAADFDDIGQATALEVASVLNREFRRVEARALALPYYDAENDQTLLIVFTGTRGLRGSVSAQGALPFQSTTAMVQTQARAAYVKPKGKNAVEVVVPATSDVVERDFDQAAYLAPTSGFQVTGAQLTVDGIVTVATDIPHGLVVGGWVLMDGLSYPVGFSRSMRLNGWFQVASVPSSTSFTYTAAPLFAPPPSP